MPYKITSIRPPYQYINQVSRNQLAEEIIKQLAALKFSYEDFQSLICQNHINSFHILTAESYARLITDYPELDFIYSEVTLMNNERIHFHTNWTLSRAEWDRLSHALIALNIKVETIPTPDCRIKQRSKELLPND